MTSVSNSSSLPLSLLISSYRTVNFCNRVHQINIMVVDKCPWIQFDSYCFYFFIPTSWIISIIIIFLYTDPPTLGVRPDIHTIKLFTFFHVIMCKFTTVESVAIDPIWEKQFIGVFTLRIGRKVIGSLSVQVHVKFSRLERFNMTVIQVNHMYNVNVYIFTQNWSEGERHTMTDWRILCWTVVAI